MLIQRYSFVALVLAAAVLSTDAEADAPGPCGQLVVKASAEAVAAGHTWQDPINHTYAVPNGDGPSGNVHARTNGNDFYAPHSDASFNSACSVISPENSWSAHIHVQISRNMFAGRGAGLAAGGEIAASWLIAKSLPRLPSDKSWTLSAIGTIDTNGITDTICTMHVNTSKFDFHAGVVDPDAITGLRGQAIILFECPLNHTSIFGKDPSANPDQRQDGITYDITFTLQQQ